MNASSRIARAAFLISLLPGLASCLPDATRRDRLEVAYLDIVAIEDARAPHERDVVRLVAATHGDAAFIRQAAVRALGRLERGDLAAFIAATLADPSPSVRAEAANALAQAHFGGSGAAALPSLERRIAVEPDPEVRGALAQSIGRLGLTPEERERAADLLVAHSLHDGGDAPGAVLLGVALGAEALVRNARGSAVPPRLIRRLEQLAGYRGEVGVDVRSSRIRALALSALGQAGLIRWSHAQRALRDEVPQVSAVAARYVGQLEADARPEALRLAIDRGAPETLIEAVRYLQGQPRTVRSCETLATVAGMPNRPAEGRVMTGARIIAIDALARPCPYEALQRAALLEAAATLDDPESEWRPAAHALAALAGMFPVDATRLLPGFVAHTNPFVRAYAAQAAALTGAEHHLEVLIEDDVDNVRTAALQGLYGLRGHAAADLARAQLSRDDAQLVLTAAGLLEGAPNRRATADACLTALDRMSSARRETWRDARQALLDRIAEAGTAGESGRLTPYLADYDPAIATAVASVLEEWNRRAYSPRPEPLPRLPLPTPADLRAMSGAEVVLHMQEGGDITIALHPFAATTNAWRFYSMVLDGRFDGLTLHRWAPNFVIQGGSPHANEYEGDAAFSRDEVGLTHWRGTVGISTRGHDTGDGQIFVNLLDNPRLDHTYTIVGTVVSGLDTVDAVFEGAIIDRAEVRRP